ncbi:DNA-3-methyladenine glycosylase [Pedobacter sp. MW01-1-1]|uniref:DNA-3-methyladenine glycosylase n=1 Tax=Pedobacter sp. MW01-1-1 TaxID=3383027 RepID=UPI003FEE554B
MKLSKEYYLHQDVVFLAKDLLGKVLCTQINQELTVGIIVETEAYFGVEDKASHAFGGRRSQRTKVMYAEGGVSYVYLIYGLHSLFNIVVSAKDVPNAVLIRAVEPIEGLDVIERRRNMKITNKAISSGPGSAAKALGINRDVNGVQLTGDAVWLEDRGIYFTDEQIGVASRVGIAYAQEHALLPLRFFVKGNKYVSKPNLP